jgi:hypothetical protein
MADGRDRGQESAEKKRRGDSMSGLPAPRVLGSTDCGRRVGPPRARGETSYAVFACCNRLFAYGFSGSGVAS